MDEEAPAKSLLNPWSWPSKPWQRVHLDFAGPFMGKSFLLAVDAHSKWGEVFEMNSLQELSVFCVSYLLLMVSLSN